MPDFKIYADAFERRKAWLEGADVDRAALSIRVRKPGTLIANLREFWPDTESVPRFEEMVAAQIRNEAAFECFAEALPVLQHMYGGRGTPMTMAAYMGGKIQFRDATVWVDPVVDSWERFVPRVAEDNCWWRRSLEFMEIAARKAAEAGVLAAMPDFGDALTCFSLIRGSEDLAVDLLEQGDLIRQRIREFIQAWKTCHAAAHAIYRRCLPGDTCWLTWAPGKVYACQCDFSVLISPAMFREFVVPELEAMGDYLDYQIFHWDGPEEIKFLDMLLEIPTIRAMQWVPGAGKPTAVHWLDLLKKVQRAGKGLCVYAASVDEARTLIRELSPRGLFINVPVVGHRNEAEQLIAFAEKEAKR